jgi:hypothetical protein
MTQWSECLIAILFLLSKAFPSHGLQMYGALSPSLADIVRLLCFSLSPSSIPQGYAVKECPLLDAIEDTFKDLCHCTLSHGSEL